MYELNGKFLDEDEIGEELLDCIGILYNDSLKRLEEVTGKISKLDENDKPLDSFQILVFEMIEDEAKKELKEAMKMQIDFIKNKDIQGLVAYIQQALDVMPVQSEKLQNMYASFEACSTPEYCQIQALKSLQFVDLNSLKMLECQRDFCVEYFGISNEVESE